MILRLRFCKVNLIGTTAISGFHFVKISAVEFCYLSVDVLCYIHAEIAASHHAMTCGYFICSVPAVPLGSLCFPMRWSPLGSTFFEGLRSAEAHSLRKKNCNFISPLRRRNSTRFFDNLCRLKWAGFFCVGLFSRRSTIVGDTD